MGLCSLHGSLRVSTGGLCGSPQSLREVSMGLCGLCERSLQSLRVSIISAGGLHGSPQSLWVSAGGLHRSLQVSTVSVGLHRRSLDLIEIIQLWTFRLFLDILPKPPQPLMGLFFPTTSLKNQAARIDILADSNKPATILFRNMCCRAVNGIP